MLSTVEKRAINLTWTKPFDGNSPLLRYILEVSENSKALNLPAIQRCHGAAREAIPMVGRQGWASGTLKR